MQLYHGNYLEVNSSEVKIKVPENIYQISDFKKYDKIYCYIIVPRTIDQNIIESDDIIVCYTPFSAEQLNKLYYFELNMQNTPGAFNIFLDKFDGQKINILECRAIDSVGNKTGRVELIAEIKDSRFLRETRGFVKVDDKLIWIKNNIVGEIEGLETNDSMVIKQGIDDYFYTCFKSPSQYYVNNNEILSDKIIEVTNTNKYSDKHYEFPLQIPTDLAFFKKIVGKKFFLGITYISEGNYLLAKFKSPNEKILSLNIEFDQNKIGSLSIIINPLANIGVNLRLIKPLELSNNDKVSYEIFFNIENTKLSLYNFDSIQVIISEHIKTAIINVSPKIDVKLLFKNGINIDGISLSDKTKAINESEDMFMQKVEEEIPNWIDKLANCKTNCRNQLTCHICMNWITEIIALRRFIERLKNSKIYVGNEIPDNLISNDILSSRNCGPNGISTHLKDCYMIITDIAKKKELIEIDEEQLDISNK